MKRSALLLAVIAGATVVILWCGRRSRTAQAAPASVWRAPYDPAALSKTIAFYEGRVRKDPRAAIDCAQLAGLYLRRYRETADGADAFRAERLALRSLRIRRRNNPAGYLRLAQALNAQHRFRDALRTLDAARGLLEGYSTALALRADLLMELGEYDAAARLLQEPDGGRRTGDGRRTERRSEVRSPKSETETSVSSVASPDDLELMPVRARLLDVNGYPQQGLALLLQAQRAADGLADLPRSEAAWFHMRVGDLCTELGRRKEAANAYREAVDLFPHDYRSMTGLARLGLASGAPAQAATWAQRAAAVVPSVDALAVLVDAHRALGHPKEAARYTALIDAIGQLTRAQGMVYDRQRALFCADHNRRLPEALALARGEMAVRHDVYAWDTLAWTAYKNGLLDEAATASARAVARGTKDPRILDHARQISVAWSQRRETTDANGLARI